MQDGQRVGYISTHFFPREDLSPGWRSCSPKTCRTEQKPNYRDDRRIKPAYQILNRFVRSRGHDNLQQLVLSFRA
ncbi:MAG TPA: hypothetical protein VK979_10305 [Guyparkeria sp.]|nr:hypothetical protein [Guyparkeria sp.]